MKTNAKTNYWKECIFRTTSDDIIFCSETELIVPHNTFRAWGISEVTSVKSGRTRAHSQEYLINGKNIFCIKGGARWQISYVSTLDERKKSEKDFGKRMLNISIRAKVPWDIAKLTKKIVADNEAVSLLIKIRKIAQNKKITSEQVYALRSVDLELRLVTLKLILGDEIYDILENVLIENEKICRDLAYYVAFKGKLIKDLASKNCIPPPVTIGYFEEFEHNHWMRIILADIPRDLVGITDSIESNEEAVELLKKVKHIAINSNLTVEDSSALKSNHAEERDSALRKILGDKIWEKIKDQITSNLDLAYFLGYYLRNRGKVKN